MRKNLFLIVATIALLFFTGANVFAADEDSIYCYITYGVSTIESKSSHEIYNAHDEMTIVGKNNRTSDNSLRVKSKRDISWSPDETAASFLLSVGCGSSESYTAVEGGTYYIRLENKNYAINRRVSGDATLYD